MKRNKGVIKLTEEICGYLDLGRYLSGVFHKRSANMQNTKGKLGKKVGMPILFDTRCDLNTTHYRKVKLIVVCRTYNRRKCRLHDLKDDFIVLVINWHKQCVWEKIFNHSDIWATDEELEKLRKQAKCDRTFNRTSNIQRVYSSDRSSECSPDDENSMDYFLGKKPTGATTDSKVDLGDIVRDIDELMVLNDEAHHVHDPKLAWFKSIEDIHNRLLQKGGELALQVDVSATPKHSNGAIFVQTVGLSACRGDFAKHRQTSRSS